LLFELAVFAYIVTSSLFVIGYAAYLVSVVSYRPDLLLLSLFFLALSAVIAFLNILVGYFYAFSGSAPKNDRGTAPPARLPKIALAVATCNESPQLVGGTLAALKKMDYPRKLLEFWLLDNSDSGEKRAQMKANAEKHGFRYVHHERMRGFKAGSLNNFLGLTRAEFFSVFDADEKLFNPKFLMENIGYFQHDSRLAFVQADKKARPAGFFADAVEAVYAFFYAHMEPMRSELGIAMYSGSQGILRAGAVRKIGGFPANPPTPTEDTQFSFHSDIAGYRGLFVKKAYAFGEPVENYSTFAKQQWKYSYGCARVLPHYLANLGQVGSWKKHLHYVAQFVGFPYSSLMVIIFGFISAAFVLSNLSFTMVNFSELVSIVYKPEGGIMDYAPIIANIVNVVVISRAYFGSFRRGMMSALLNFALAFKRSEAALAASLHDLSEIVVTPKAKNATASLLQALRSTGVETAYATSFLALSAFSLLRGDLVGGFWMMWYASMFYLALAFHYRYK
jgi:cellulose synthase/poly-beta-1,6-N-acetylglucosamine synthase-like glycosyltransferase